MATDQDPVAYRVLARKYRPSTFSELIGQQALVRTLSNAIESGRIAHAYMLTGVRGVGKTTTARIIARALNCIGPDGTGGITAAPCGVCEHCVAIAEDRHVDVIEMDAASRTGVGDIRELIEGVRYKPVSGRFKVYIIDEVHMLSGAAFNALLKTLEEPPEHVRFVFATTEIRKVPVTVLSRCQRFDLRRLEANELAAHFRTIAEKENVEIDDEALSLIARAADGSVRDGLSLLDQAIALGAGKVVATQVRDMLGIADRATVFDLFDELMAGEIRAALDRIQSMYRGGADPAAVLQDLLDATYWVTRIKIAPEVADASYTPEIERRRGREMTEKLDVPSLTRTWQMLLKGLDEVRRAQAPLQAAEMVLVRLAYVVDLPTPAELARIVRSSPDQTAEATPSRGTTGRSRAAEGARTTLAVAAPVQQEPEQVSEQAADPAPTSVALPQSFAALVELFGQMREVGVQAQLINNVHLVRFEPGRIELRPNEFAPRDLANRTATLLSQWTGERWIVSVSQEPGEPTLAEQEEARQKRLLDAAESLPLVQAVKTAFPGAAIRKVTPRQTADSLELDDPTAIGDAFETVAQEEE